MPSPGSDRLDLKLVRRYEPVIRYTQGELFLPARVEDYLAHATLHATGRGRRDRSTVVAEAGALTPESLADLGRTHDDESLYLQFVADPLTRSQFKAWRNAPDRERFQASSRFASVGLMSRLIDSTMRLTLLLRGKVPGGYAAAAQEKMEGQSEFPYYAHVTRDAGYVVLQYWFLYAMNDWRSTFGGVNDHEADWEQVTLFLAEGDEGDEGDEPRLAWVAFSSHDEVGDDLRRRADDPDITYVDGTHPVVYAGAGSHSGAYLPGEYIISVGVPLPGFIDHMRKSILRLLPWSEKDNAAISIPYIDYRRGDGPAVGPGQDRQWEPVLIDDETDWVTQYRGLWGLDTRDPLGGERAPAGPRYGRGGTVRESWRQPVAWAGLDKEAPTAAAAAQDLLDLREMVAAERATLEVQLGERRLALRGARSADRADGHDPRHASDPVHLMGTEVADLRGRAAALDEQAEAADRALARPAVEEPVHAHLRHRALPMQVAGREGLRQRLLRIWAAASASVLLGVCGILLVIGFSDFILALLILVGVSVVIEAVLRGRLVQLIVNIAVTFVLIVAVWAVVELVLGNISRGVGVLLLLAALYMGWQTIREGFRM